MRRTFLLAYLAMASAQPAGARDLTVVGWGGSSQAAQHQVFYVPFAAQTGIKVQEDSWSGGIGILRTKAQAATPDWDVVQVESDELALGCDEGLFARMDFAALGGRDAFAPAAVAECGVGSVIWSTALAFDADKLKDKPMSWADFWDMARFPGKRTMRRGPKYTLEFALMADGVAPKDVYTVLRSPGGVDRAFRKLDALKPNIVWWTAGAQPGQLLASGEVTMAAAYTSRMFSANRSDGKHFAVVWPGSLYAVDFWAVLKRSPNAADAQKLVAFMTAPANQSRIPALAFQGVTNLTAQKAADPAASRDLPTDPANLQVSVPIDVEFWIDNTDQLTQRFNAWASQ